MLILSKSALVTNIPYLSTSFRENLLNILVESTGPGLKVPRPISLSLSNQSLGPPKKFLHSMWWTPSLDLPLLSALVALAKECIAELSLIWCNRMTSLTPPLPLIPTSLTMVSSAWTLRDQDPTLLSSWMSCSKSLTNYVNPLVTRNLPEPRTFSRWMYSLLWKTRRSVSKRLHATSRPTVTSLSTSIVIVLMLSLLRVSIRQQAESFPESQLCL